MFQGTRFVKSQNIAVCLYVENLYTLVLVTFFRLFCIIIIIGKLLFFW